MFTKAALIAVAAGSLFSAASSSYDQAIQLNPNDAESFKDRGNAYAGKGQLERAIADYDQAIRLNPNFAEAFNNRGIVVHALGQRARAAADFAKARQLKSNLLPRPTEHNASRS